MGRGLLARNFLFNDLILKICDIWFTCFFKTKNKLSFVNQNHNGLYGGLMYKLKEEGDNSQVINLGCTEMPEEDAKEFMKEYKYYPYK